jgi:hypothetical protein
MSLVWYAAYGSNLLRARFLAYLEGGSFEGGPPERGCADPSPPRDEAAMTIRHRRYFAYEAARWGGGGVAFVDPYVRGTTLGRAYLVTEEQFADVLAQENGWPDRTPIDQGWYRCVLGMGEHDGVPLRTITSLDRGPLRAAAPPYLDVIRRGEAETKELPRWP